MAGFFCFYFFILRTNRVIFNLVSFLLTEPVETRGSRASETQRESEAGTMYYRFWAENILVYILRLQRVTFPFPIMTLMACKVILEPDCSQ